MVMKNFEIHDDSNFEAGRCSNGGNYGYWQTYQYNAASDTGPEHYVRQYHTTHEFGLCKNCGDLCQSPQDYDMHEGCDPRITVAEALADVLVAASRAGERAAHFDGPAVRVVVAE
jgi:hypothetical protein